MLWFLLCVSHFYESHMLMFLRNFKTLFLLLFGAGTMSWKKFRLAPRHKQHWSQEDDQTTSCWGVRALCVVDLDPSLLQHFKKCSWEKWFLGAQSKRSFTLLSFTSTLPIFHFSPSGPAHTFIALQAAAGVCLWQSGGFVQVLLPMEVLRLLGRPWQRLAQMQLCLNCCVYFFAGFH